MIPPVHLTLFDLSSHAAVAMSAIAVDANTNTWYNWHQHTYRLETTPPEARPLATLGNGRKREQVRYQQPLELEGEGHTTGQNTHPLL